MGTDLTRHWAERAAIKDKKLREELAARTARDDLEAKEERGKDADLLAAAIDTVLAANAQRYRELQDKIDQLDTISLQALIDAQQRLEELLHNANRARDGRAVFEAADGTIYDQEGNEVGREEIDWSTWRDDGASWDQYESGLKERDRVVEYRQRLGEHEERLQHDPDEDDLEDIERELDELEAGLPSSFASRALNAPVPRTTSAAKSFEENDANLPSVKGVFYASAQGVPAPAEEPAPATDWKPGPEFTPV